MTYQTLHWDNPRLREVYGGSKGEGEVMEGVEGSGVAERCEDVSTDCGERLAGSSANEEEPGSLDANCDRSGA